MPNKQHPSLADLVRSRGDSTLVADSRNVGQGDSPTFAEISETLFFSPGDGRIWLNDQRMVLLHSTSIGGIRRELIDAVGIDAARGILTRMGYSSGARDAGLVLDKWPNVETAAALNAGVRLHSLKGVSKVETVHFKHDFKTGKFDGEFLWHHSVEDDEQIAAYGIGSHAACWMELGYAIGFVSHMCGRLIIFREVECRSMGHAVCRVYGRNAEDWDDIETDLRYINAHDFLSTGAYSLSKKPEQRSEGSSIAQEGTGLVAPRQEKKFGQAYTAVSNGSTRSLQTTEVDPRKEMVGVSAAFNAACHSLRRVAPTTATVLFNGESGVGKELFASMLHQVSPRGDQPFIAFNCAAMPENLVEAELFGVEKGAFTGATHSRRGRFERAHGGTLFLDEISSLSITAQGKLLRALQEKEIERVGGDRVIKVDVRVVAAANVSLQDEVAAGRFRADLYFRLNVFPIHIPPLRERRDDIPLLMNYFLERYCLEHNRDIPGFTSNAVRALLSYNFPGNVRELQNLIERGVIATENHVPIDICHIFNAGETPATVLSITKRGYVGERDENSSDLGKKEVTKLIELVFQGKIALNTIEESLERAAIDEAIKLSHGNLSSAARMLSMTRTQLAYRLQKFQGGDGA